MDSKLTLKLDKDVIERGKAYAEAQGKSLSKIFEDYLKLIAGRKKSEIDIEITPFVKSIRTGAKGMPTDLDYKKEYRDYLAEKHK